MHVFDGLILQSSSSHALSIEKTVKWKNGNAMKHSWQIKHGADVAFLSHLPCISNQSNFQIVGLVGATGFS